MANHIDLILDSGAFSAWKKQITIPVEQYIEFIKRYDGCFHEIVNLDSIPGSWGIVPSPLQVEESAAKSYTNLTKLRKAGIEAMPVYHMGERQYWLEKMINDGYQYIGISPANDRTTEEKIVWLDEVFEFLCGKNGFPEIKTHGFGVTALPILYRYPWYSADSVTWLLVGGYGGILVPRKGSNGAYDFTESPLVITVSMREKNPDSSADLSKNFAMMGPMNRKYVLEWVESQGFDIDGLKESYLQRQRLNCRFFKLAAASYVIRPFVRKSVDLFAKKLASKPHREGLKKPVCEHMKFVFTLTTSPEHSDILEDEGVKNRLLTYYYFMSSVPFDIRNYVATGRVPPTVKKKKPVKRVQLAATAQGIDDEED